MADNDLILQVKDLTVSFGNTPDKAVEGLTYDLQRGKTLGIVGESGSGKSVSSLALMHLLPRPPHCTVGGKALLNVDGHDIDLLSLDENQMRNVRGKQIAMIFQEPMTSLNPVYRCGEQVVEMLKSHEDVTTQEARERAFELFDEVALPHKSFNSYPHELSGGQKQRIMIAMALICNPSLLIADEPTTALDVTVQHSIVALLRTLQERHNLSIIFITHDLGLVAQVADEIAVMYRGRTVEQGSAEQILHNPSHPYTKGLIASRPPLNERPLRLLTVSDFMGKTEQPETQSESPEHRKQRLNELYSREPLLKVRNLSVEYTVKRNLWGKVTQRYQALNGIDFDLYEGETLGLVGESGCGKTTLGRTLLRLTDPTAGTIIYRGTNLLNLSHKQMRTLRTRMQIVFQDPYSSLNPRQRIGQAIMEPMEVHHIGSSTAERHASTLQLMEQVGLKKEWFDRYPHEFSGGQRQRVCIARALAVRPELVVCDESVSALDVSVQAQVLNLLNDLKREYGFTCIFISHDLSIVHYFSDRIMVMRSGRLVEIGEADELYQSPKEDYTRTLIEAIPVID